MKKHEQQPFSAFMESLLSISTCFYLVLVSELVALSIVLAKHGLSGFSGYYFGLISLFMMWVIIISASGIFLLYKQFPNAPLKRMLVISYIWTLLVLVFCSGSVELLYYDAIESHFTRFNIERMFSHVAMGAIFSGLLFRYLYLQQLLLRQQKAELNARIQALQSRIRPHFLFNSMNIIASLIATDPDKAEQVVEDLSELFRASLNEVGNQVPISQEIKLCKQYLSIELLRLSGRADVEWHVDEDIVDQFSIPLLTLQPLIENAIYHGIQPRVDGGTIIISVGYTEPLILINVVNPLAEGNSVRKGSGNQMAIENIRLRLTSLYGADASLTAGEENGQFVATLSFPAMACSELSEQAAPAEKNGVRLFK